MKGGSEGGYEGSGGGYEAGDWLIITTVQGQLAEDCQCVPTFLSFVRTPSDRPYQTIITSLPVCSLTAIETD